jgi:hypothetical protein
MKYLLLVPLLLLAGCGRVYVQDDLIEKCTSLGGEYSISNRNWLEKEKPPVYRPRCTILDTDLTDKMLQI